MNIYSGARKRRKSRNMATWGLLKRHRFGAWASRHQTEVRIRHKMTFAAGNITTLALADWLQEREGAECIYCAAPATAIDHRIPLCRGGTHTWSNIQLVCKPCNSAKARYTEEEFLSRRRVVVRRVVNPRLSDEWTVLPDEQPICG